MIRDFFSTVKRYFTKNEPQKGISPQQALDEVKKQFEDHLQAINENTVEIQSNHSYLSDLDLKLNKLSERIEQIQLFLKRNSNFNADAIESFEIRPLSRKEQYVFLVLYALEDEKGSASYWDIARKTGFAETLVREYLTSIIEKGVPIVKKYINGRAFLKLDKEFKRLQAKENILMIDTAQKELINF